MPDPLRGKWRYQNSNWIQKYIDEAKTVIRNKIKETKIACFFTESILGCGGQVILPKKLFKRNIFRN